MEVIGHTTEAMFKRYADLFSEDERRAMLRKVQERRCLWREEQIAAAMAQTGVFCKLKYGHYADKITRAAHSGGLNYCKYWLRGVDLNHRPLGYE